MKTKRNIKVLYIFFALLLLVSAVFGGRYLLPAFAETSYSGALEDLQKDENFNENNYPDNAKDYSVSVIQIAESADGELFIYTYQPCQKTQYLVATDINMSLSESVDKTRLYSLMFVSCNGVLCKYKVNDLTVSNDKIRCYNITSIYREWIKNVDLESGTDNEILKVSYSVGQLWQADTESSGLVRLTAETDVVVIENAWNGTVRYVGGLTAGGVLGTVDSHFVAFSCDHKIDELKSAEVFYSYRSVYHRDPLIGSDRYTYGEELSDTVTVKPDRVTVKDHFKKHEWSKIESVSEFVKNEDLTQETKEKLNGMEWVLRFAETDYSCVSEESFTEWYTEVTGCTILRLEFEYAGKTYNLGVVDNVRKPDTKPDNNYDKGLLDSKGGLPWWVYLVIAVVALAILLPILSVIFPVVGQILLKILNGIWWIISLPFRIIGKLFKKKE